MQTAELKRRDVYSTMIRPVVAKLSAPTVVKVALLLRCQMVERNPVNRVMYASVKQAVERKAARTCRGNAAAVPVPAFVAVSPSFLPPPEREHRRKMPALI
jgi:hypothetical protein